MSLTPDPTDNYQLDASLLEERGLDGDFIGVLDALGKIKQKEQEKIEKEEQKQEEEQVKEKSSTLTRNMYSAIEPMYLSLETEERKR